MDAWLLAKTTMYCILLEQW